MRFYGFFGLVLWLAATLVFRLWGGALLDPDRPLVWLTFILVLPGIPIMLRLLFAVRKTPAASRPKAAVLIALPGMLLDMFSVGFHKHVFPGIPSSDLNLLFIWLLWAYSLILAGGFLGGKIFRHER
ncbi:DUF5367 family protein [Cohnella massiliensis]|uniref:DUF5367 family protein n=1 Tax=Cohnella massiliensis TaxID=1816691 RepID=UPI00159435FC|nr:DUF5367 family protein [Cohnella massiliensis]